MTNNAVKKQNISFTAHYTGFVWYRFGLGHRALSTSMGRILYAALSPFELFGKLFLGQQIKSFLLQRHLLIDACLAELSDDTQIIELACGLSPRGHRLRATNKFARYIETDLPDMAHLKKELLSNMGDEAEVQPLNILSEQGEQSFRALLTTLDKDKPLALVCEGLIYYFDETTVEQIFARLCRDAADFDLTMIGDIYPRPQEWYFPLLNIARKLTALITRSRFHFLFNKAEDFAQAATRNGFDEARILDPANYQQQGIKEIEHYPATTKALVRIFHLHKAKRR